MAQAALPLMLASSAVSAFGAFAQGQSQAQAYAFNARVARQQATEATDASYVQASQTEGMVARRTGEAKAATAAAGVDVNTGTSLHVLNDIASQGEMQRQLQLYQGKVNSTGYEEQADADTQAASASKAAGWLNAGSTLLSSASQASFQQKWGSPPKAGS